MRLIYRFILREHFKVLILTGFALTLVFCLFVFFDRWDDLVERNVATTVGLRYMVFLLPQYLVYILPVSILLSSFIALGLMARTNELTAIRSMGIGGRQIAWPIVAAAAVLSLISFIWSEGVVPAANREATRIWQVDVEGKPQADIFKQNDLWFRSVSDGDVTLIRVGFIKVPEAGLLFQSNDPFHLNRNSDHSFVLKDVTVLRLNGEFRLSERIDAREVVWEDGHWVFSDGMRWMPRKDEARKVERFQRAIVPLSETPEDFQIGERKTDSMGFFELKRYVERARSEGFDVTAHLTDLYFKPASALFSLVIVLFTIPLALRLPTKAGGIGLGVALSLVVAFVYYLLMSIFVAFGHSGKVPPVVGAWGANVLFGGTGLWLTLRLKV